MVMGVTPSNSVLVRVMNRAFLATAAAVAPLLLAAFEPARATTTLTGNTSTPVATATANNGQPDNVDLQLGATLAPTASAAALTLNSNNTLTSEGAITFSNIDNAIGMLITGGVTGSLSNTGSITLGESYTAPINPNTGLAYGDWASGGNRFGILVGGPLAFTGNLTDTGTITIQGNGSYGLLVDAPVNGQITMLNVTPVNGSTPASVQNGSINVTGNGDIGVYVSPNGSVNNFGGVFRITSVTARGIGAEGVQISGDVAGEVNLSSAISASGYRSVNRPTSPIISTQYTADQLDQGGPAVSIAANLGQGLIISAPPFPLSTTNLDQDADGVPDSLQGSGSVASYGSAPALQIGSATRSVELGLVGNPLTSGYGLVIQGSVTANSVYDPLLTPVLITASNPTGQLSATAIQIGGFGGGVLLDNGLHNTGSVSATAYQGDATAIHVGPGASVPTLANDGSIFAISNQINSATAPTTETVGLGPGTVTVPTPNAVNVTGVLIDAGGNVPTLTNSNTINATLSGAGGVGGTVSAVLDKSGTLTDVENSGSITAALNQTFVATPITGPTVAINAAAATAPQTLHQFVSQAVAGAQLYNSANSYTAGQTAALVSSVTSTSGVVTNNVEVYEALVAVTPGQDPASNPTLWKAIGTQTPTIVGDIYLGSGGSTINVTAGTVLAGKITFAGGANTVTVDGPGPSTLNGIPLPGTVLSGSLQPPTGGTLSLNVGVTQGGTLSDTNPATVNAGSVNVGAAGVLEVAADPVHGTNTLFLTSGPSTFAQGAQVGLTLASVQIAPVQTYTILETTGSGTLSVGGFGSGATTITPYLYTAAPSYVPATGGQGAEVQLTVTRKTAAELGFNASEAGALEPILNAIPNDANIQATILAQTTEAGLKSVYDQLLPDQGQGIFESLDAAAQSVASMTAASPDAGVRAPGTSLWLQEVNTRVDRSGITSLGSQSQLIGVVAGAEHEGERGGALGATLAYLNAQESVDGGAVGEHVVASMVEAGLYYRRAAGPLTVSARGAGGYAWFNDVRRFLAPGADVTANSDWGAYFVDAHAGAGYEVKLGRYYVRPELSVDYLRLAEGGHAETGGTPGFDLTYGARTSTRFSGEAVMVLGAQWGKVTWLRSEIRGGYRDIFAGQIGDTVANFTNGSPFALAADPETGGWATVGFSLKGGTPYSYVALEGDADFRSGQQRYDLRVAGRSMF